MTSSSLAFPSPTSFIADSITRGAHFFNATARVEDDRLRFTGTYDAAELLPILLFSVGMPWVEPCVENVCCLWEVVNRYKDNDLLSAIGGSCNENMNFTGKKLMKGSLVTDGGGPLKRWDLTTKIHPNFIVMLFLCLSPVFYMYYEMVPIQWIERKSVVWSSSWYGDLCHTVTYPDGREVCIHCSNRKPQHSAYVFSADWFQTFECKWICESGYTGPNCEVAVDTALYAAGGMFAVMCVSGIMLVAIYGRSLGVMRGGKKSIGNEMIISGVETGDSKNSKSQTATPKLPTPVAALVSMQQQPALLLLPQMATPRNVMLRSEIISFKENAVGEIRIKLL
jgi:hypothetical protein